MSAAHHTLVWPGKAALVLCCMMGAGCVPLLPLGGAADSGQTAPAATLVPIEGILAQADSAGMGEAAVGSVTDRAAQLRNRAEELRRR